MHKLVTILLIVGQGPEGKLYVKVLYKVTQNCFCNTCVLAEWSSWCIGVVAFAFMLTLLFT